MSDIDRLHLEFNDITGSSTIIDSPSGEYVLYDDHLTQLSQEQAKVTALEGEVERFRDRFVKLGSIAVEALLNKDFHALNQKEYALYSFLYDIDLAIAPEGFVKRKPLSEKTANDQ